MLSTDRDRAFGLQSPSSVSNAHILRQASYRKHKSENNGKYSSNKFHIINKDGIDNPTTREVIAHTYRLIRVGAQICIAYCSVRAVKFDVPQTSDGDNRTRNNNNRRVVDSAVAVVAY